jgi:hypothetical protein
MKKRRIAICLIIALLVGLISNSHVTVSAQTDTNPAVTLTVNKKIDVALSVGATGVDYSGFSKDLKAKLLELGQIPEEDINISELESQSVSTSNSSFKWWVYDHTIGTPVINDSTNNYTEKTESPNEQGGHPYYNKASHIETTNNGADLFFMGYGSSAYKDFMYLENNDPTTKTFQFDIIENEAYDALDGVGFLFNTTVTGNYANETQKMSGYLLFFQYGYDGRGQEIALYKFDNLNTKNFHHLNDPATIDDTESFKKLGSSTVYSSNVKYRKIKIEAQPSNVKVWYKGSTAEIKDELNESDIVSWTQTGNSDATTKISFEKASSFGFGPLASYRGHGCSLPTSLALKNLTMSTEKAKTLKEVITEPEWNPKTSRYIVNLNEDMIEDLEDTQTEYEIINRLNNDDVTYIGWGSDTNEKQTEDFIGLNDSRGGFVNIKDAETDTYDKQITAIAEKILKDNQPRQVSDEAGAAYVLTSESVQINVNGASASDTADANWPNGKWKIVHSIDGFSNTEGIYSKSNVPMSDLECDFSLPGKYEIYYEDVLLRIIIAHRQPVAYFTTNVSGPAITGPAEEPEEEVYEAQARTAPDLVTIETVGDVTVATGAAVTYNDLSYDPDGFGLDTTKTIWKYIDLSVENPTWVTSDAPITAIEPDHRYLVSLIVTDLNGAVSSPYTRQISYSYKYYDVEKDSLVKLRPFADFELSEATLIKGINNTVLLTEKSYDIYGEEVTSTYTVTRNGVPYEKAINIGTVTGSAITSQIIDFSGDPAGTYKISLKVTSTNGNSEVFSRTIDIIDDKTAPTAVSNVPDNATIGDNKVVLTFKDLGGSGLKSQLVSVDTNPSISEDTVWQASGSDLIRTVLLPGVGTYYIHYEAIDNVGNADQGTFGPITYKDSTGPTVSSNVSAGSVIGVGKVVLTFTDNSGIKKQKVYISTSSAPVSTDSEGWSEYSEETQREVKFKENGTYYIHYYAQDNEKNITTGIIGPITYSDITGPSVTASISNDVTTGDKEIVISFDDEGSNEPITYKVIITKSTETPSDSERWIEGTTPDVKFTFPEDGTYYIHYKAVDAAGNESSGYLGPFTYVGTIPYIADILAPVNGEANASVNTLVSFEVSEKVMKGDGYLTVYNSNTGKKYLDIHSSNNKVKINGNKVTVELPKTLEYETGYYIKLDTNFIKSVTNNAMAEFGSKSTWSFTTAKKDNNTKEDDVKILRCEAYQIIDDKTSYPQVIPDAEEEKTFTVYAEDGELYILPVLNASTDNIIVEGTDCEVELLNNPLRIKVKYDSTKANPSVTVKFGDNNSYTLKIKKLEKELKAEIKVETTVVTASVGNSNLLNTVDISADVADGNVSSIKVMLLIREPQKTEEKDALKTYVDGLFRNSTSFFFDATLIKTVSYDGFANDTEISNTQEPVTIMIDIPASYRAGYNYQVVRYHAGVCENLPTTVINNGTQLQFETDRFSTYGVVYTTATTEGQSDAGNNNTPSVPKEISVPETITATAGQTTSVEIKNLPEGASVEYHVSTPTYISVDAKGNIFAKKTGKAVLMAAVTSKATTKVYTIRVNVQSAVKPTKVGFIQYYNNLVNVDNINYRITKDASETANGTVAVANNQVNEKLSARVTIPAVVTISGKKYDVTSIDESAFYMVSKLVSVSIPSTVTDISSTAFTGSKNLVTFKVDAKNPKYSAKSSMLLDKAGTTLLSSPSATGKITVDSKIKVIGAYAFSVNKGLKEVIIPATVKEIRGCAFAHSGLVKAIFKSNTVPVMPYPCVFEDVNAKAVIYVPKKALKSYTNSLVDFRMPTGVTVKAK